MPYNYPVLLQLLDELFKTHRLKPTNEWRIQFNNYLKMMPAYYAAVSDYQSHQYIVLGGGKWQSRDFYLLRFRILSRTTYQKSAARKTFPGGKF